MKISVPRVIFLVLLVALNGCTTYWRHPYKNSSDLDSDNNQCKLRNRYESCRTEPGSSETRCRSDQMGGMNCTTSTTPPQTYCSIKVNYDGVQSCLKEAGWRETDEKGNYIE
jgi:hypothetical protein